jgi:hypothetical protein
MDFKVGGGATTLTAPAIALQDLFPQLPVIFIFEPDRRLFRPGLVH